MGNKPLKSYSLEEMKDKYIGKTGTPAREEYEHELRMDIMGHMIKKARQERKLTQEQLGKLVGVQKAQISKLESSANSATIGTIIKVFTALKADICFSVKLKGRTKKTRGTIGSSVDDYAHAPVSVKKEAKTKKTLLRKVGMPAAFYEKK